jgi:hypothetical protein
VVYIVNHLQHGAKYGMIMHCTKAPDYGNLCFIVNGHQTNVGFDGYSPSVVPGKASIGHFSAVDGKPRIVIRITGANMKMIERRYMFGLDCIQLIKIKTHGYEY